MNMKTVIGSCTLYLGDTMEILPRFISEGERYDLLVCDPPYELTSGGCTVGGLHERFGNGRHKYGNTGNLFDGDIPDWSEFMPLFYQCLKDRANAYVMADSKNQFHMQREAIAAGFKFHNLLRWNKRTATPNRYYMKNDEFIGFFYKGAARMINNCSSMAGVDFSHRDVTGHPTEKPVSLMQMYIENSSSEGDVVVDPFMGVGSTAVAAVQSGRAFVGIERDKMWYDAACERVEHAYSNFQQTLF